MKIKPIDRNGLLERIKEICSEWVPCYAPSLNGISLDIVLRSDGCKVYVVDKDESTLTKEQRAALATYERWANFLRRNYSRRNSTNFIL